MTSQNDQAFLVLSSKLNLGLKQKLDTAVEKLMFRIALMLIGSLFYLNVFAQVANTISPADKVFGLSKFWQEVNYNFVYLDKINRHSWDSTYKALIPQVQATQNDYEYYRLMEKFCALLRDGHTEIFLPPIKGLSFMNNTFGEYLIVLKRVDNKVIIKRTWKKDAQKFPLGSEILEVNGLPTEVYIRDSIAPYISSSTDYVRNDISSGILLMGAPGSTFTIKIQKPDGQQATYRLTHARTKDDVFYPNVGVYPDEQQRKVMEWNTFGDNISYIAINSFASDSKVDSIFETRLPFLEKSKGIIIDLRYNGGGDDGIAFKILKHFIKDSVIVGASSFTRAYDPYLKAIGRYVSVDDTAGNRNKQIAWLLYHDFAVYNKPGTIHYKIEENTIRLTAPVVILISHNTESTAEDFLIGVDNQRHIIKIGEPTNGSTGQPYKFDLPGRGSARICIKKDVYPDGREFVGKGIQPDITVNPTVKDYLECRDIVLEAALNYLKLKEQ